MSEKLPKATHKGVLPVAGVEIPCFVIEGGKRVITQRGLQKTIGLSTSGGSEGAHRTARFVSNLEAKYPETSDLAMRMFQPLVFLPFGGKPAYGYEATTLIDLCEFILRCDESGILGTRLERLAVASNRVIRAFAKVGIIAVIDEVTGYQEERDREELQKILAAYIAPGLMPYTSRFPMEFFEEMFRLRNWPLRKLSNGKKTLKGPRYAAQLTEELIYKKLPPGVADELKKKNPIIKESKGQRKYKLYRYLTGDIGDPHLTKQVAVVTTLMKISPNWRTFERHFERAFPKPNTQVSLFPDEETDEEE